MEMIVRKNHVCTNCGGVIKKGERSLVTTDENNKPKKAIYMHPYACGKDAWSR